MDENAKAKAEEIWSSLKDGVEQLSLKISELYTVLGSSRNCRHINELWHPENPGVNIGFVPPEARDIVETILQRNGVRINKGNGPLGKGVYFSLLYDEYFTPQLLTKISETVDKELEKSRGKPRVAPEEKPDVAMVFEAQVARVDGIGDQPVSRSASMKPIPAEVTELADVFNRLTAGMSVKKVLLFLIEALPHFEIPDVTQQEILRTLEMMRDAETSV